jgi:hypothetical protein
MPEPDLIQQQRDILRTFRQASAQRAQAETQRKTERAAANAELGALCGRQPPNS